MIPVYSTMLNLTPGSKVTAYFSSKEHHKTPS